MSEPSDPKKSSIPEWQRGVGTEAKEQPSPEAESSTKAEPPPSRPALLEQAAKFVEEDEVRDAPRERKVAFLESKGLDSSEIQKVLSEAKRPSTPSNPAPSSSESPSSSSSSPPPPPSQPPTTTPSSTPPIITYPESLRPPPPPSPPPLITASRLLSTLYLASSLSLTLYGCSKYIVNPMISNLNTARHELATTAATNISTLNTKISTLVSEIPSSAQIKDVKEDNEDSDAESEISDPNELFHRDYGTQTSPSLSRRPSTSKTTNTSSSQPPPTPLVAQENRLSIIRSHLSELLSDHTSQLSASDEVSTRVQDLTIYLDGLHYSSSYYSSAGIYGGAISGAGLGGVGATAAGGEDMVAKVKAEIRGVKGVLLSARNFPGGAGRMVGRVAD
ncbi:MAG: hypothetical protein M1812_004979 [Candelaria pacifica]|nr:MAG: hypothetical protein M1812_004979 [Candelaria pacifica]